ncbi:MULTISPECIES: hypothetical protein [Bacillota]|uniref:hypothetical protein n=1 Tax=Bacillota TaxID=1239 RepID=UPI0039F0A36A
MGDDRVVEEKKRKLIEKILNHPVQGEVYILTQGRIWKALVLKHFSKVQKGEITILELVEILEKRYAVKYTQKYSLIQYPIEECLKYIAKVANKPLELNKE